VKPTRRYLYDQVQRDLQRKMVFVAGPRQVGKTTLALSLPDAEPGYLNWDVPAERERILRRELPAGPLWIFDEIHKYRQWRNYLKGLFDDRAPQQRILVTGSGRLDLYRFGGDSLQGRYHLLRLHPFSLAEVGGRSAGDLEQLVTLGGFPEPFLSGSETEARRWSREYRTLLVREEVTSLERIQDLGTLELMMLRLPELVGSPLSINALREDLGISHKTASSWLQAFERLFVLFRVAPFGAPKIRAVKKEQKAYLLDWTTIPDRAARFENLVACNLLKWVHYQQDVEGRDVELRYFRDTDRREVDFVLTERGKPFRFIECKLNDREVDPGLRYLVERFPGVEAWQISLDGNKDFRSREGVRVAPAGELLRSLV
jgi:hypothetical protein